LSSVYPLPRIFSITLGTSCPIRRIAREQEQRGGAERAEQEKKVHELYAEIGRLSTELEWLKKKGIRFE